MNLFTENLERLFETVRKPDGKKYTEVEIEASSLQSGLNITKAYIQRLRRGESTNPSYDKIVALAKHFNVHPGYFFEKHKGYGTALHREALRRHGALAIHRKLFLQKILSD